MTPEELMKPRYRCIGTGIWHYPGSSNRVGDIISITAEPYHDLVPTRYPHLFKFLQWWEGRTIKELKSVKYVKIVRFSGYYFIGSIIMVEQFEEGNISLALPSGFYLAQNKNHFHAVFDVIPATKEEYDKFRKQKQ